MNGDQTPAHATPPIASSPQDPNLPDLRNEIESAYVHELGRLQKDWWWFLILGIVLVIGGTAAIVCPWVMSYGVVIFIGAMLLMSGVIMIISAFWVGKWSAFGVQILIGLLYMVAGYVITDAPTEALAILTLMLAGFLVVGGGFHHSLR